VLREAVTNVLRHAVATACVIQVAASGGALRLHVGNDGAPRRTAGPSLAESLARAGAGAGTGGDGRGLANLDARVRAAGGRLITQQAGGQFGLTAELRLDGGGRRRAGLAGLRRPLLPGWPAAGQPAAEDVLAPASSGASPA
jgi:two-component system, NarL family, sensor histidine kinase DesK